jgi:hypothetical protein
MVAGRLLEEKWRTQVEIDIVAYPGICLVSQEDVNGLVVGMAEKFFQATCICSRTGLLY